MQQVCMLTIASQRGCMNKISIRGVVVGGVTDILATVILTIPLVVYVIIEQTDILKDPLQATVTATLQANPLLYGLESLIGLVCSVLGGYVAARVAKHDELLNGLLASSLPVALGVYPLATANDSGPLLLPVLLLMASPLCSGFGGHLRLIQIRGRALPQFDIGRRDDEIFTSARDALQKIRDGVVDAKQVKAIEDALDLKATGKDHHKLGRRNVLGSTLQIFLWKIVLSALFWAIALIVIAVVVSHAGIDLLGLSKKLTGP
jgi:hypothetical protein